MEVAVPVLVRGEVVLAVVGRQELAIARHTANSGRGVQPIYRAGDPLVLRKDTAAITTFAWCCCAVCCASPGGCLVVVTSAADRSVQLLCGPVVWCCLSLVVDK